MSPKQTDDPALDSGSVAEGIKMVLTVTIVAAVAAGMLGVVYSLTKERIAESRTEEKIQAFGYILPAFGNEPLATGRKVRLAGVQPPREVVLYTATDEPGEGGSPVGYALETYTTDGFGPRIDLLVGATPDGTVTGVYVLNHQETPGLGAKITDGQTDFPAWRQECVPPADASPACRLAKPFFLKQFANRHPDRFELRVKKDGGDVDAITASTITSRAVTEAVARAAATIRALGGEGGAR